MTKEQEKELSKFVFNNFIPDSKIAIEWIKDNFAFKEREVLKHYEIATLLNAISIEITVAAQSFFAWKSINNTASNDSSIHKSINSNALSWNIILHSLQTTFFISIGRIFDTNSQSCSIHLLFRQCKKSIKDFEKYSICKRKIKEMGGNLII